MESFVPQYYTGITESKFNSDSFKEALKRTKGTMFLLIHPFFGEDNSGVELNSRAQQYYEQRRDALLRVMQARLFLPSIVLMGTNEIVAHPDQYNFFLSHSNWVIPTPPGDPVPDASGNIRYILDAKLKLLSVETWSAEDMLYISKIAGTSVPSCYFTEQERDEFLERAFSILNKKELESRKNNWNDFLNLLRVLGVKKVILSGKAYYETSTGHYDGCVPETYRHLVSADFSVVCSGVRYIEPYGLGVMRVKE